MEFNILRDGVYFLDQNANIEFIDKEVSYDPDTGNYKVIEFDDSGWNRVELSMEEFLKGKVNWKSIWIGHAYETSGFLIMDKEPERINTHIGYGFNYGSTNAIKVSSPGTIIVLAEND